MKGKEREQEALFPPVREEMAGELTPALRPGPITRAHRSRSRRGAQMPEAGVPMEDPGIWTRESE